MTLQNLLLVGIIGTSLYCVYRSTKSIARDIQKIKEADRVQLSFHFIILSTEYENEDDAQEMLEHCLHKGGYDEYGKFN